jgi:hypothetical protein
VWSIDSVVGGPDRIVARRGLEGKVACRGEAANRSTRELVAFVQRGRLSLTSGSDLAAAARTRVVLGAGPVLVEEERRHVGVPIGIDPGPFPSVVRELNRQGDSCAAAALLSLPLGDIVVTGPAADAMSVVTTTSTCATPRQPVRWTSQGRR